MMKNTTGFIRECVCVGLTFFFKEGFAEISKLIGFPEDKQKDFQKLDLNDYFYKRIDNNFIDKKKARKMLNKINIALERYQKTGVYLELATIEGDVVKNNTANIIFNFYVLYWLNKIAVKLNFYRGCELDEINYYVDILTDFESYIYKFVNIKASESEVEETWQTLRRQAYNRAVEISKLSDDKNPFADIMPIKK